LGKEFEDVFTLTYTTGNDRPYPFIKAHAGIAVCVLAKIISKLSFYERDGIIQTHMGQCQSSLQVD
jgi:hypothetical protein